MLNKIIDKVKNLKDWIYNKKPSNKYLRVVYYILTGLFYSVITILLTLTVSAVISIALGTLFWLVVRLFNANDYAHLSLKMLAGLLFLLAISAIGYISFGDN